jgi:hypothetical protein
MGRLYISAENHIDGPWLLGHDNLASLNVLFKEIDIKLSEALTKTIENTAKQQMEEDNQALDLPKRIAKLQRKYNQKLKFAEVTFEDGSTYKADDIEGIINYVDSHISQAPTELYIRTVHGNYENEFDLIINSNADRDKEEIEFEYRIRCIDEEIQQKIKTLIDKWIRENKPHRLLQIWSNIIPIVVGVGLFVIFFSFFSLSETISKAESYKVELKKEAQKMIEDGHSSRNVDSTLLLLLKIQSDYVPNNIKSQTIVVHSKLASRILIVSSILVAFALVRPKTIIGIGKKYGRLKLYKYWIKFVLIGSVGLIITTVIKELIPYFFKS